MGFSAFGSRSKHSFPFPNRVRQNGGAGMRTGIAFLVLSAFSTAGAVWGQTSTTATQTQVKTKKHRSPGGDVGSGAGDIGKGAGKGAGDAAKGVGKGAANLVTLHPIDAAASVGKGAGYAGKDVAVGTTKGTGKIAKGVGRGIKRLF
jgi:hypothetical protein